MRRFALSSRVDLFKAIILHQKKGHATAPDSRVALHQFIAQHATRVHNLITINLLQHAVKIVVHYVNKQNTGFTNIGHRTQSYHAREGTLVQWLKLPAWKFGDRGLEPHSGLQVSKKQNVSFPLTRNDSILQGTSVTER